MKVTKDSHFVSGERQDEPEIQTDKNSENPDSEPQIVNESEKSSELQGPGSPESTAPVPYQKHQTHPLRALFRKNLTLQKRQTCTNACQILTPVIVVVIMLILELIIKGQIGNQDIKVPFPGAPFPMNSPYSFGDFLDLMFNNASNKTYEDHTGALRFYQCYEFFLYADETGQNVSDVLGILTSDAKHPRNFNTLFGNVPQDKCDVNSTGHFTSVPCVNLLLFPFFLYCLL